jgi:hypothetical protein
MPENKRRFETDVFPLNSVQLQPAAGDKDDHTSHASLRRLKEKSPYSKEMILRLIEWLKHS